MFPYNSSPSVDLDHMRAVKNEKHQKFAGEHDMSSHFISARTDDQVLDNITITIFSANCKLFIWIIH